MTEVMGFFGDLVDIRHLTQIQWLDYLQDLRMNGYVYGSGSGGGTEIKVTQHAAGPNMSVDIATGEAWVQGCWYLNDAVLNLSISAADATYPRIDRIVVRNRIIGQRSTHIVVLEGIAAAVPVATALTQTEDLWELCIAEVNVAANAASIINANIIDKRDVVDLCGTATPKHIRMSDILALESLNVNSQKITGLALPTASSDGVTIQHRDINSQTIPIGMVYAMGASTIPTGWLECDGAAVSRVTYADLFAAIGTTYGVGDGSTTFNLPNGKGKSIFGYDPTQTEFNALGKTGGEKTHILTESELPAHYHSGCTELYHPDNTGLNNPYTNYFTTSGGSASTDATGGGLLHANLPPYIVLKWMVKT
jgi:microcystin-dependent protein